MFFYPMQDFSLVHVCLLVSTEPVSNVCSPNCEPWSGSIFKQYPLLYKTQFSSTTHNSSTIFKQYQSNILYFIQHNFELTPSVGSVASHLWSTNSSTTKVWTVKCVNESAFCVEQLFEIVSRANRFDLADSLSRIYNQLRVKIDRKTMSYTMCNAAK